ncbi:unnamed protein product [Rotaria sp. Silwood2]|nr:unnamed protein product [Rotaria sp. Silwood2]CAF3132616.1 unnamed protein product [Rotaria sp. Silwood2]CAF4205501.1 unnamed protein product [Rotaria sp. Silwood2]CAF4373136.1 unnamed protein product [Rotaria sp. Silwood2]
MAEPNQDYSRLVREKAKELEKQIELFEKENAKLQSLCNEQRIETLEYENAELKQEKEIIKRRRLDLMHQLQTVSKQQQQLQEDI